MPDFINELDKQLQVAQKEKNALVVDTLRGLKNRIQNEHIAKGRDLEENEIVALVRSEIKRRKEAAEAYKIGGRDELEQKELKEAAILESFVPAGPSTQEITNFVRELIAKENLTAKDFGQSMGKLKTAFPNADGSELAKILKENLK